jgi:hypothetical protein
VLHNYYEVENPKTKSFEWCNNEGQPSKI